MFRNLEAEQARRGKTNGDMAKILGISRVSYESKKKTQKFTCPEIWSLLQFFGSDFSYLFDTSQSDQAS